MTTANIIGIALSFCGYLFVVGFWLHALDDHQVPRARVLRLAGALAWPVFLLAVLIMLPAILGYELRRRLP